ncbi:MAG: hypothetical protein ACKOE6_09705, partial [Flammeovirgaceae bacterium]
MNYNLKFWLMLGCLLLGMSAHSQSTNYYNFAITGPTSVCPDGITNYTYYGPISDLTWTVTGGVFVGGNGGASVVVRWNSPTGSLSASGQQDNCWYDTEQSPPVVYCDTNIYTSLPFSVSGDVALFYLAGGAYCAGGTGVNVVLQGSQVGVSYQLLINGTASGAAKPGTGSNLTWNSQTTVGTYTVTGTRTATGCTQAMYNTASVTQVAPTLFNVTGGGSYCTGGSGVSVMLSSSQTDVNY